MLIWCTSDHAVGEAGRGCLHLSACKQSPVVLFQFIDPDAQDMGKTGCTITAMGLYYDFRYEHYYLR